MPLVVEAVQIHGQLVNGHETDTPPKVLHGTILAIATRCDPVMSVLVDEMGSLMVTYTALAHLVNPRVDQVLLLHERSEE